MSGFSIEDKIEALSLCYSETGNDYTVKHQNLYIDICGVNPYIWGDFIKENNLKHNSIKTGYYIYKFYLSSTGSQFKALKEYKGIKSKNNIWIIFKVQRVIKEVKKELLVK